MQGESILLEAERLTSEDRNETYGHPLDNFSRAAAIWSAILGIEVTAEQVALCKIAMKMAREVHQHGHDNLIDIAGYARTLQMVIDERARRMSK